MHASQVHRLTALSKKCFTDGSFPFFFRLTDLSTKLRWCPICLCTFKIHTNTHSHTLTYCLHKKTHAQGINSIKCLPFKFHFWSPWLLLSLPLSDHIPTSPPVLPRLFTFLSSVCQTQSYQQPRSLLPVISLSFSPPCMNTHLPCNPSDHAPCCAEPTLSNAADGWAAHAWMQSKQSQPLTHTYTHRHKTHSPA